MKSRFAFALALFSILQVGRAEVTWTRQFTYNVPVPVPINKLLNGGNGILLEISGTNRWYPQGPWRVRARRETGEAIYTMPFEGEMASYQNVPFVVGRRADFFALKRSAITRFDSATGDQIWEISRYGSISFDDEGNLYVYGQEQTTKISYVDGRELWQTPGYCYPLKGSSYISRQGIRTFVGSKTTGETLRELQLSPPPTQEVWPVPMKGDQALLISGNRAYGYRPSGAILNLGLDMGTPICSAAPDGSLLMSTGTGSYRLDSQFHRAQTLPPYIGRQAWAEDTDTVILTYGPGTVRMSKADGTLLGTYPESDGWISAMTNAKLWSLNEYGILKSTDLESKVAETHATYETQTLGGKALTGMIGPGGDLLLLSMAGAGDLYLSRFATTGERRWTMHFPHEYGFVDYDDFAVGMSLSGNKRVLSFWKDTYRETKGFEVDITKAKLLRSFGGFGAVAGNAAYRSNGGWTSKFNLTTGKEIWRIPRTGPIRSAPSGTLIVGGTLNRDDDGQLVWATSNPEYRQMMPVGGYILETDVSWVCLRALWDGRRVGFVHLENRGVGGFEENTAFLFGSTLYFRDGKRDGGATLINVATQEKRSDYTGFFDSRGSHFFEAPGGLFRSEAPYLLNSATFVCALPTYYNDFVSDGDNAYMIQSAWPRDHMTISRWQGQP